MLAPRWVVDAREGSPSRTSRSSWPRPRPGPRRSGQGFTHWGIRKLAAYLSGRYGHHDPQSVPARVVRVGRERVRVILHQHDISFQRTRTGKTSTDRSGLRRQAGPHPHSRRVQDHPGRPPRWRPDLHRVRQPVGQHHSRDPGLGRDAQGRAVYDPDQPPSGEKNFVRIGHISEPPFVFRSTVGNEGVPCASEDYSRPPQLCCSWPPA